MKVTFTTSAVCHYQLEAAPDVTGPWSAVGDPIVGNGSPKTISSPTTGDARRFYGAARNN